MKTGRTPFAVLAPKLCAWLVATLCLATACASEDATKPPGSVASVQALIGEAACRSDAQCATIGVGAKPCGGPGAFVAWSTAGTDAQALRAAAQRQAQADRKDHAAKGMLSTCSVVPDPGAFCDIGRAASSSIGVCRLRSASGSPAR